MRACRQPGQALEGPLAVASAPRWAAISPSRASTAASACPGHGAPLGEDVVHPPPVLLHGAPLHQAPGHQAVDHGGDAGRPDGQALGQVGGDGRALVQQPEDPVLGQGQVGGGQADLDLLGQPRRRRPSVRWSSAARLGAAVVASKVT